MTGITFGVSASPFAANMTVQQNAIDHLGEFPLAAEAVLTSFYVDDGLTGADSIDEAISLQNKVAPIKRLTIPCLELCGAYLLTKILHRVREVLKISFSKVFTLIDSTIVLDWLKGNPR